MIQTSKDGDKYTVPIAVAQMSELVKNIMNGMDRISSLRDFCVLTCLSYS
jgi:Skp1 family, tetramerisation domain